jgi:hypothetical protein
MAKEIKEVGTVFTHASQTTHINTPGKISIEDLSSVELISPAGRKMAGNTAPRSAFEVEGGNIKQGSAHDVGMFDAPNEPPLPPVHMGKRSKVIGTEFTEATTNHNPTPPLPLMTKESAAAAKRAAPRNAFKTNLEDK